MAKNILIWKGKDGKVVETDEGVNLTEMQGLGYTPAPDTDADAYLARRKAKGTIPLPSAEQPVAPSTKATATTGIAPSPQMEDTRPYDEGAVKRIKDTAASTGQVIDDGEAIRRARNLYGIAKESEKYGTLRATPAPSTAAKIGTAIEGFISGFLPFGELITGAAEEAVAGGQAPVGSSLGFEAMRGRREESPITAGGSEIAGIVASLGLEALPRLAMGAADKLSTRLANVLFKVPGVGAATKVARSPFVNPLARGTLEAEAKLVGATEKLSKGKLPTELADLGDSLAVRAEKELGRYGVIEGRSTAKGLSGLTTKTERDILRGGKLLESKGFSREQVAKVMAERQVGEEMAANFDKLGGMKVFGAELPKYLAGVTTQYLPQVIAGTLGGAGYAAQRAASERLALTDEEVAATAESFGAAVTRDALKGAAVGAGLSVASPLASAGLRQLGEAVESSWKGVASTITEYLGPKRTAIGADEIAEAFDNATKLSRGNLVKQQKQLLNTLQAQHDYTSDYIFHLGKVARKIEARATADGIILASPTARGAGDIADVVFEGADLPTFVWRVRKKFMDEVEDGIWVYNKDKVLKAIKKQPFKKITVRGEGGKPVVKEILDLPEEIREFQAAVGRAEFNLRTLAQEAEAALQGARGTTEPVLPANLRSGMAPIRIPGVPMTYAPGAEGAQLERGMYDFAKRLLEQNNYPAELLDRPFFGRVPSDVAPEFGVRINTGEARSARYEKATREVLGLQQASNKKLSEIEGRAIATEGAPALAGLAAAQVLGYIKAAPLYLGARYVMESLVNPAAAIRSYQALQTTINAGINGTKIFSKAILGLPATGDIAGRIAGIAPLRSQKEDANLQVGRPDAAQAYKDDREFFMRFRGATGLEDLTNLFSTPTMAALDTTFPEFTNKTVGMLPRQAAFLNAKMEKMIPASERANPDYKPPPQQLYQYGLYSRYTISPDLIYNDIADKRYVPEQAMEVLRAVYPARLAYLRSQIFNNLVDMKEKGIRLDRVQEGIVNKIMTDDPRKPFHLSSADVNKLQQTFQVAGQPPAAQGGPTNRRVELEREGTANELGK